MTLNVNDNAKRGMYIIILGLEAVRLEIKTYIGRRSLDDERPRARTTNRARVVGKHCALSPGDHRLWTRRSRIRAITSGGGSRFGAGIGRHARSILESALPRPDSTQRK